MNETRTTRVYAWLTGQEDNIGDSALRRPYAAALATTEPVHVWAGRPDRGYVSGLRLPRNSHLAPTFARWCRSFVSSVLTGRTVFAFNAGEFVPTKAYVTGVALLLPWIALAKARGGAVIWVGAGVRSTRRGLTWPFVVLLRLADIALWRDVESASVLRPAPTMPDWAFGLPRGGGLSEIDDSSHQDDERTMIAISLRGDRPYPSAEWIESVRELGKRLSLDLVVTVQVERDDATAHNLAKDLGAQLVSWTHDRHDEQEILLRAVYAKSRIVLSDRLHALVIAATEGAAPIGWCEHATTKVDRHFAVLGLDWVSANGRPAIALLNELTDLRLQELAEAAGAGLDRARAEIRKVSTSIGNVVQAGPVDGAMSGSPARLSDGEQGQPL